MSGINHTRRALLKASAAALSVPYLIDSSVLGAGNKPSASERITVGFIGVGNRGRQLCREFLRCEAAQVTAVSDCYENRREPIAKAIKGKAYRDFRDILARKDIDAVVVPTPDHWHVPIAVMAARAGKDAYVEKPLGISIEQDLICRQVFTETKRIFQYGTQQRSMQHCRQACELVRSGAIGPLEAIQVIAPNGGAGGSTQTVSVPEGFDYEMWNGPAEVRPYTADRCKPPGTYWIYDYSIGYLGGWGAHPLDLMVWGSDADTSGMVEIEGSGKIPDTGLYNTVYDWDVKGKLGNVDFSFKPGDNSTKFIGPDGWIRVWRGGIDAHPKSLLQIKIDESRAKLISSDNHAGNFIESVKTRKAAISNVDDSVRSDTISHLCNIAIRSGRRIKWDPAKHQIVGDAEAAKMMHRPMRAPWTL